MQEKKNVLLITGGFPPEVGGIQNYVYNLCKYSQHNITVLAPEQADTSEFDSAQKFEIVRKKFLRGNNFIYSGFSLLKDVIRIIKSKDIDIIVCNHVLVSSIGNLIKHIYKKPFICITYGKDTLEFLGNPILKRIVLNNLNRANSIITCSNYTKKEVENLKIEGTKVYSVEPGVDSRFIPKDKDTNLLKKYGLENKKIIYTISRLVERKGHDNVIKSMKNIIRRIPNVVYLIVGDGEYRKELEDLVVKNNLADYVVFTGKVREEELLDFYNLGDVFVMPCRYVEDKGSVEGFGIVYLEAAACRKPIIGGNSGGAPEAVGGRDTGILVDPSNIDAISNEIIFLLEHKDFADEMAKNARKRIEKHFSYEILSKKFDQVITHSVDEMR
ncbi:glycosyltransferase family 4 protein [Paenibacillus naphthalenovorans]|uniref:glycosyltransferase family 4 protein n=1 Tax=Paenibacillus naphthalenovorans TaxID=162209 RepID=UPI003D27AB68